MKFEIVREDCRKFPNQGIKLPTRKTINSAGYDFYSNENVFVKPNETHIFWTDIKADVGNLDLYLQISIRSSLAKEGLCLSNGIGIIDADYYDNESNDGNIGIMVTNLGNNYVKIQSGDRIAQGIICLYYVMDDDVTPKLKKRTGGIGSTGK